MFVRVCKHLGGVAVRSRITLSVSNIFWVAEGSSARSGLPPTKYGLYQDRYTRIGIPGSEAAIALMMVSMP
jgi:hypothetical protein